MKKSELINELIQEHEVSLSVLDNIPESISINFYRSKSLYLNPATYEQNMKTLHELRCALGEHYKLKSYYASDCELALNYAFSGVEVVFYCTDRDVALQAVSKGRCSIVETAIEKKVTSVVCDLLR